MALLILAEHATTLLDIIYNISDEKDRVVLPYLQSLVTNLMAFVRTNHSSASNLLMNISQYPYTRKAWKKEVFDYLFDIHFFQNDISTLRSWKGIISNWISNEKTSFRDIFSKINTASTGLFISKETENEQRIFLLKRFAFTLYSSSKDQYQRSLPEILLFLTDNLKIPPQPILQAQIFLLFRILLLRISNRNLLSFWPILVTELLQIFIQIEQELRNDLEEKNK